MTTKSQIWKCEICGNIIEVLHQGADALVCCGQPMVLQEAKKEDEGKEHAEGVPPMEAKHKPIIEGNLIKVGSIEHPMIAEHHIEWIDVKHEEGESISRIFLGPGQKPGAEFSVPPKSARAYGNLHGLWKSE